MGADRRDPVATRSDESTDLYGIAEWEVRTRFDRVVYLLYHGVLRLVRIGVILSALAILLVQFVIGGLGALADPFIGAFTVLSVVPALGLAAYVWYADVTSQEPLGLLVATFLFGVLFAGFAGVLNVGIGAPIRALASVGGVVPALGSLAFFYLVVGPVEEAVKLLAVRIFAYRSDRFDAVVDGAVYGAAAGLGFATIENAVFITRTTEAAVSTATQIDRVGGTALVRSLAGPGHVIYSAFAGYYLGLAKFNAEHAGPLVLKGLLVAAAIHATYNSLVGVVPGLLAALTPVGPLVAFFAFVVVYDGVFGLVLLRKINAYHRAYVASTPSGGPYDPERTEFES